MVTDNEKEKLRDEARKLLKNFSDRLEKVDLANEKEGKIKKESGMREEGNGNDENSEKSKDFRKRIFNNVPEGRVEGNKIIAEKKSWS